MEIMDYVSRTELGWPASAAPSQTDKVLGVKIHYEGSPVPEVDHSKCAGRWTQIRRSHLANTAEGYSDVAYNWAVCNHGVIFEGRGLGKRTGANGSQPLNRTHYAILWMGGTSGVTTPSAKAVAAIKEVIKYLRGHGTGKEIKGHRDGHPTACPGDALYALVKSGKLEPSTAPATSPAQPTGLAPYPGAKYFRIGRTSKLITELGRALERVGYRGYRFGPGPTFTSADKKAVRWFQLKQGWTGADADGIPGAETWKRLKVRKPK